jgi:transaldolase
MTSAPDDILGQLAAAGVSIWLDDINRERLTSGNLGNLIRDNHVTGVTSNPTIFAHALASGDAYQDQVRDLALRGISVEEASRVITTYDVRWAADVLRPVWEATDHVDGRVSIEVDPRLAKETAKTVAEARALWWLVDRPNAYIKIPATAEGVPAIAQCLSEGISINVTLIFSLERYGEVIDAYFTGLEQAGEVDLSTITSVASFFVSRMDTEVDGRLDKLGTPEAAAVRGKTAVANARLAYELYQQKFSSERWAALEARGAHKQKPLWASTSTKDPSFNDTMYIEDLVAPGTVNTMPEATLHATAAHGTISGDTITTGYDAARKVLADMEALGISYDDVVAVLESEAVEKFAASWQELLSSIESQLAAESGK